MNDKEKTTEIVINVPLKISIEFDEDCKGYRAITDKRKCQSFAWTSKTAIEFLIENIQNLV